jgi:hypothetical protein
MARITFSALLSAASGKIGDVVASRWKGLAYVRRRVVPSNPQSGKQCKQRFVLKSALTLWQSLKAWANAPWILAASGYAESGYNLFMDQCMTALAPQFTEGGTGEDPTLTASAVTVLSPYNAAYAALITPAAAAAGSAHQDLTWTQRAGVAAANKVRGFYRLVGTFAWSEETEVLESAQAIIITPLTNNVEYEIALVPYNSTTGAYGQSSHFLCTPTA